MEIKYEKLSREHIHELIELQKLWEYEDITYGLIHDTYEKFEQCINDYSFVAVNNGEIIGFIDAEINHDNEFNVFPSGSDYLEIHDLYVKSEYRGNKIGSKLLELTESAANRSGIINIYLASATKDSEKIRRFYTDNGYRIWTTSFYKRTASDVRTYDIGYLKYYRFVVIFARYNGKWIFARHKERATWECAGGHIEPGESAIEAAKRELYEETGAVEFAIRPVFDYSVHAATGFSNGQVYLADVTGLGDIPESEMAEICLLDDLPIDTTYPKILSVLFDRINKL